MKSVSNFLNILIYIYILICIFMCIRYTQVYITIAYTHEEKFLLSLLSIINLYVPRFVTHFCNLEWTSITRVTYNVKRFTLAHPCGRRWLSMLWSKRVYCHIFCFVSFLICVHDTIFHFSFPSVSFRGSKLPLSPFVYLFVSVSCYIECSVL